MGKDYQYLFSNGMKRRMWAQTNNAVLGLLVAVVPFLGLPETIKTILFVVFGLLIILFSLAGGLGPPAPYEGGRADQPGSDASSQA